MSEEMVLVDVEKIDAPRDVFRDLIDPDKVRELAESIRSQGLYEPILVRPANGRFEIVFGHRRWLAHRLIGKADIKAIVREMSDQEVIEARAVENDQRVDLNPIERAKTYKRLKDRFGMSHRDIARKMGRSPGVIDKYIHLLEMPDEFQDAVARGIFSMGVALCLNQIDDPGFKSYYFNAGVQNGVTLEVAEMWVNDWRKSRSDTAYNDAGGGVVQGETQESLPIYLPCVCCLGPVEISKLRTIHVCEECLPQIRGALKPK
jgi:ParB family chromosome partitioning protein